MVYAVNGLPSLSCGLPGDLLVGGVPLIYQRKQVTLNDTELEECCSLWMKRLRLQDWEIRLLVSRHDKMDPDTLGHCLVIGNLKIADIHLIDPCDINGVDSMRGCTYDMEKTLVHELLHIHHWDCSPSVDDKLANQAHEQAIELTAMALVAAYRNTL